MDNLFSLIFTDKASNQQEEQNEWPHLVNVLEESTTNISLHIWHSSFFSSGNLILVLTTSYISLLLFSNSLLVIKISLIVEFDSLSSLFLLIFENSKEFIELLILVSK